ncbi:hypothetical protein Sp245p_13500 [Azospirillum baldaniorum]|uniref:Uncharacterized protein n=1 Tax=Azospirillum baldaniorum TaxID=1064539 RepID=A0A9P1JP40_9PROT|nr:hypothetical protein [Azospirillum baldaniorum]AWJ90731.1 hypothetical protein Sp245p_13500 [Azospirillum baldaniorum]TWA78959.1 hypothetical protein FBZ85_105265 [Azospirillum brasilense]CCC97044.1 protein of unknown function [Azospirillum baldaniorum]
MNAVLTFDSARGRRMSGTELSRGAIGPGGSKVIPFRSVPAAVVSPAVSPAAPLPRRPAVPSPARAAAVAQPAEPAPRPERLARLIYMASVGGYMAVREDTLVQLDGRMVWPTADALIRDAAAAGVPVSSHVINTARS